MNEFRERLKKLREKEGTQPCVLAELCGISKNSILRYERDGVIPEIVSVVKIADHFNVSVDYLLGGKGGGKKVGARRHTPPHSHFRIFYS